MKYLAKVFSFLLVATLLLSLGFSASAESVTSAEAFAMRLMKTNGSVFLTDLSNVSLSVREGMRLSSGRGEKAFTESRARRHVFQCFKAAGSR